MAKSQTGTLIRHGDAPYDFNQDNKPNYFVELEVNGEIKRQWGLGLKDLMDKSDFEQGDQITLLNHGKDEKTNLNVWEINRYYEPQNLNNTIEKDATANLDKSVAADLSKPKQSADYATEEVEYQLPNSVRNRYTSVLVNQYTDNPMVKFFDKENPASVAFEDRGTKGLHTSHHDEKTITAMLDMAESKGWSSIKLKGSQEFKREAWIEAQIRGIQTKGYEPSEQDKLALKLRQEERTTNQIEATKIAPVVTVAAEKTVEKAQEKVTDLAAENEQNLLNDSLVNQGMATGKIAEDKLYHDYMREIEVLEVQANDRGIEFEGFDNYVKNLNERYGNTPADRIQHDIDEVNIDPQGAGYEHGWDLDTDEGKLAYGQWLGATLAEKQRNVSEIEMSDYISSLQEKIREFDKGVDADREAAEQAAEQHRDLKEVETEAYVRAEEFQRGRDIDPDLNTNINAEAEQFRTNVVAAPKVAGMTNAAVTRKVEAAFDRKIDGSMAAAKRDDFREELAKATNSLPLNDKVKVETLRNVIDHIHKDNPQAQKAEYQKLSQAIKSGAIHNIPDVPDIIKQQSIDIQPPTQSNKDRGR